MAKHYATYLFTSLFMLLASFVISGLAPETGKILPYITIMLSVILLVMACGLFSFFPRTASIIGLICLVGFVPLGYDIVWVFFIDSAFYIIIILMVLLTYVAGVIYSLKTILNLGEAYDLNAWSQTIKVAYTSIPAVLLLIGALFLIIHNHN